MLSDPEIAHIGSLFPGYSVRERSPQRLPDRPPFTAHLGNLAYDITNDAVAEFFEGCDVASVRLIEDRELQRPKGFGYVEFANLDGLKKALTLDGESFQGRTVRIKVADPREYPRKPKVGFVLTSVARGGDPGRGDSIRELGDWTRKGPLSDPAPRAGRQPSDFGERRPPRDPAFEGRPAREARELTWERRGPLAPVASPEGSGSRSGSRPRGGPEGLGERSESHRGNRHQSPAAWGEERQDGSRPPRRDFAADRPERVVSAADKDMQWRDRMRPDSAKPTSPDGSEAPPSPALSSAAPAPGGRPRLNLQKRTVAEAPAASPTAGSDSKASPFGAARPIDTAAKEKEIEEKRQQTVREKREAEEKAKEERRLAKEAAAKAEAEAKEEAAKAPAAEETKDDEKDAQPAEAENGEKQIPVRTREPREPKEPVQNPKSRAAEATSWRSASTEQRGPRGSGRGGRGGAAPRGPRNDARAPRTNGSPAQQPTSPTAGEAEAAPATDEDGWETVPKKKGRAGRP